MTARRQFGGLVPGKCEPCPLQPSSSAADTRRSLAQIGRMVTRPGSNLLGLPRSATAPIYALTISRRASISTTSQPDAKSSVKQAQVPGLASSAAASSACALSIFLPSYALNLWRVALSYRPSTAYSSAIRSYRFPVTSQPVGQLGHLGPTLVGWQLPVPGHELHQVRRCIN